MAMIKYKFNKNKISINKRIILSGIILFCGLGVCAQSLPDSLNTGFSFGLDGSRVFNQLFRANQYSSLLYLEYELNHKSNLRLAGDVEHISGEEGKLDYQIKVGYKRFLKQYNNWRFYAGMDLMYQYEFNRNSQVELHTEGVLPYVGATYQFSDHFSLTTEPTLYLVYKQKQDKDSFNPSTKYSNELGLTSVGVVRATFHF